MSDRHADPAPPPAAHGETMHACPPDGSGLTPCCHRTPLELPRGDRITSDPTAVTCTTHAPAQVDEALTQRVAAALYRHEWPNAGPWADALAMDHEAFLALAAVVLAELAPELERLRKAERAVNILADSHRRAERAETALTRVRELHHRYRSPLADHDTCAHCNRITGDLVPWPCDTIRALTGPAEENTP